MISSLVIWNGPTENIWAYVCKFIQYGTNDNLDQCKKSCLEKTECTAINYKPGIYCDLRKCPQPVPDPDEAINGYNGYYVEKGTIKEYA